MSLFSWLRHRLRAEEPFVRLPPKDNFYQSVSFFPMPFALVSTVNERGVTSLGPYSLAYPFELIERPSVLLVARASSNTVQNLLRTRKAALNFLEFDRAWLEEVVRLGFPGQTPEEKMAAVHFELEPSPTDRYARDPEFPLLMRDAFQVWECELSGNFAYHPARHTDPQLTESFLALELQNVLLRERFAKALEDESAFPSMALSYGFRHQAGKRHFFFAEHKAPFPVELPEGVGPAHGHVFYVANKLDPEVRFTEEACKHLVAVPAPFLRTVLSSIVAAAKERNVKLIDESFVEKLNAERSR